MSTQKKKGITFRGLHRDLGYFYVGLIISFSISGIALNHRNQWSPYRYTYQEIPMQVSLPANPQDIDEKLVKQISVQYKMADQYERFRIRDKQKELEIRYEKGRAKIDLQTGKGQLNMFKKKVVLAEMTKLHQTLNKNWVWYSDIFGIAMLTIAITGMFITRGKKSFRKRGYLLAIAGIIFPLIFLFLL
ncbi:PepSY-associated TM helix domain-containing protein [Microscilla marina]|uniref:PepSY-associated TM helix family n=1 Tax=Microscilla marina ATCC 23134 TaxID=313606 RepID=A1ZCT6_MICM2|nr:PepSY-associated TM helix domain-containing protein [Microscilla marina]EAY32088.1 hypothetical protein M23134_02117 [Microscilla marina ATCC 23134]